MRHEECTHSYATPLIKRPSALNVAKATRRKNLGLLQFVPGTRRKKENNENLKLGL